MCYYSCVDRIKEEIFMGDMLVSMWSIMANFGFDTADLANKIANIIAKDENGNYTGTLAPVAEIPLIGTVIGLFADIGNASGQATPTTIS
jgi:hypothetical protein